MQSVFNITSIIGDYTNKKIVIQTNFTVNPETVNKKNIQLSSALSGTTVIYKLLTDNDKIIVELKDWPDLNTYYEIIVKDIKDKLNRDLTSSVTKNIKFESDTKLKVKIKSPNNNEALVKEHNLINFSIIQINPDGTETTKPISLPNGSVSEELILNEAMLEDESEITYHFEFASDIAFFDIVKDYKTPFTDAYLQLDNGQYFMRVRAIENNNLFSDWSEVITFTVVPDLSEQDSIEISDAKKDYIDDLLAPVEFFFDDMEEAKIIFQSKNGITYPEFCIEFNKDIDTKLLPKTLMSLRRDL